MASGFYQCLRPPTALSAITDKPVSAPLRSEPARSWGKLVTGRKWAEIASAARS